jgi:shikimate dehydrogenase
LRETRADGLARMKEAVPMPILTGQARVAGIFGWPIAHSRSPRMHGYWLERHGIDGAYVPFPVEPGNFALAVRGLRAVGARGGNVTAPHKVAAFDICDTVDDSARRAGAVNTLFFEDTGIRGANTDGVGFLSNLRAFGVDPAAGPALLLGAGGAARAIAAALLDAGVSVTVANRTPERAAGLAGLLPGLKLVDWSARSAALADHALVVNTTSQGMHGKGDLGIDFSRARPGSAAADIVYVPLETPFLAAARAAGLRRVDGLGMLLHQGVPGFSHWFGVTPVVDEELRRFVASDLIPA